MAKFEIRMSKTITKKRKKYLQNGGILQVSCKMATVDLPILTKWFLWLWVRTKVSLKILIYSPLFFSLSLSFVLVKNFYILKYINVIWLHNLQLFFVNAKTSKKRNIVSTFLKKKTFLFSFVSFISWSMHLFFLLSLLLLYFAIPIRHLRLLYLITF